MRLPRFRRLGLRARITLLFALGAMLLSTIVAGVTWTITSHNLVDEREAASQDQFLANATQIDQRLADADLDVEDLLSSLPTPSGAQPILFLDGDAFTTSLDVDERALPSTLRSQVQEGQPSVMTYRVDDEPQLAQGVLLPGEQEARRVARKSEQGVPLDDEVLADLLALGRELGISAALNVLGPYREDVL